MNYIKSGGVFILFFSLMSIACNQQVYELELTPDGERMHRQLSSAEQKAPSPSGRALSHLRQFYPTYTNEITEIKPAPADAVLPAFLKQETKKRTRHTWSGVFGGTMPGEFGGFGRFHSLSNSMGSASLYMERYSGSDDIAGLIEESWNAIDVLMDDLVSWLDTQIKQEKGYSTLRQFLNKNFRQDLKNLRLYMFQLKTLGLLDQNEVYEKAQKELLARFSLYLVERGYFKVTDLPVIMKALGNLKDDQAQLIVIDTLTRFIAGKMGVPKTDPLPEFLTSLQIPANLESLEESFSRHFRTTEYYQNQLKRNQKKNKRIQEKLNKAIEQDRDLQQKIKQINELHFENELLASIALNQLYLEHNLPQLKTTDPGSVYDELIESATGNFVIFNSSDRIKVKINLPLEPIYSNGKWHEGKMTWEDPLDNEGKSNINGLPAFSYAVWVQPNEKFQKKHFGKVAFNNETLVMYCLWYASLSKAEEKEWNEFTAKLKPSTYDKQLEQANFSDGLSRRVVRLPIEIQGE